MGGAVSFIGVLCDNGLTVERLQKILVRLSIVQIFLGILDAILLWLMPTYRVWPWIATCASTIVLGVFGIVTGLMAKRWLLIMFGLILGIPYGLYVFGEYCVARNGDKRILLIAAVGVTVRAIYGIIYLAILIRFYKAIRKERVIDKDKELSKRLMETEF
eukprot:TRINITY_DN7548_c0_g1_i1.p1 TRINITY_DN7548_c0_g1~~TRINITY_DN7548_c0_g1_i1.p1  ORF type:complete len:160 (-),score=18.20 TRINITY_DN7548_c0_g1_i1:2-481(-)